MILGRLIVGVRGLHNNYWSDVQLHVRDYEDEKKRHTVLVEIN